MLLRDSESLGEFGIPVSEEAHTRRDPYQAYRKGLSGTILAAPVNKEHTFEIKDGKVHAQVHDTMDLRAAFLHYCSSSMRPSEMQLAVEGPFMSAHQFTAMARDLGLVEPEGTLADSSMWYNRDITAGQPYGLLLITHAGPLPLLMLGITYATVKDDDQDGLSYPHFLDALLDMAFECGQSVAQNLEARARTRQADADAIQVSL